MKFEYKTYTWEWMKWNTHYGWFFLFMSFGLGISMAILCGFATVTTGVLLITINGLKIVNMLAIALSAILAIIGAMKADMDCAIKISAPLPWVRKKYITHTFVIKNNKIYSNYKPGYAYENIVVTAEYLVENNIDLKAFRTAAVCAKEEHRASLIDAEATLDAVKELLED